MQSIRKSKESSTCYGRSPEPPPKCSPQQERIPNPALTSVGSQPHGITKISSYLAPEATHNQIGAEALLDSVHDMNSHPLREPMWNPNPVRYKPLLCRVTGFTEVLIHIKAVFEEQGL